MENTYCAFLRGVNVNGRNMKMTDVQEIERIISSVPSDSNPELHCYVFISEAGLTNTLMTEYKQITPIANEAQVS